MSVNSLAAFLSDTCDFSSLCARCGKSIRSEQRLWHVGICGGFDVENYGDLLFPFIAESELNQRLEAVQLHRFSYTPKSAAEWCYDVTSVESLPEMIRGLDAMLIGGGFIVRFDKEVAPEYHPPRDVHHPTGFWLTPALIALQHDVPVMWNAPGMHCNPIPQWAHPILNAALSLSRYVSVRDEPSRAALQPLTRTQVRVVPDSAFALRSLVNPDKEPSAEYKQLCEAAGLLSPYIVVQPSVSMQGFAQFVQRHAERFRGYQILALPISRVFGEHEEIIASHLPDVARLPRWPSPLLVAEFIARAEAAIGHSYHFLITALVSGVPAFTLRNLSEGKYTALRDFEGIYEMPTDPDWFLARVGRRTPSARVLAAIKASGQHWDHIAEALCAPALPTSPTLNRFWQSLPGFFEHADAESHRLREISDRLERATEELQETLNQLDRTERQRDEAAAQAKDAIAKAARSALLVESKAAQLKDAVSQLAITRADIDACRAERAKLIQSYSWKITAPLRFAGRCLLKFTTQK